jgi:hypothetical protein
MAADGNMAGSVAPVAAWLELEGEISSPGLTCRPHVIVFACRPSLLPGGDRYLAPRGMRRAP